MPGDVDEQPARRSAVGRRYQYLFGVKELVRAKLT